MVIVMWAIGFAIGLAFAVAYLADWASAIHQSRNRIPRRWWRP